MACNKENRIGVIKTGTDESMSNKWGSNIVKNVPDVLQSLQVVVAPLGDLVVESERLVKSECPGVLRHQIEILLIQQLRCGKYGIKYFSVDNYREE